MEPVGGVPLYLSTLLSELFRHTSLEEACEVFENRVSNNVFELSKTHYISLESDNDAQYLLR